MNRSLMILIHSIINSLRPGRFDLALFAILVHNWFDNRFINQLFSVLIPAILVAIIVYS
jgi:hypothetical protein